LQNDAFPKDRHTERLQGAFGQLRGEYLERESDAVQDHVRQGHHEKQQE
jgi:hypothetical protein